MKKAFDMFSRLMPLWIVLFGVAGYFLPSIFLFLNPHIDWMFFFTMIGIGAVLNFNDFLPIVKKPSMIFLGLLAQFMIMPALGYAIGLVLNLSAPLRLGLIIAGAVPGAMASNVIAYLAKTDVAYSIAITSTATLISPILTPLLTFFYARTIINVPFMEMFFTIIKIVILPLVIGFVLRHFYEKQINSFSYIFPAFSTIFICFICAIVVSLNRDYFVSLTPYLFSAVFLHNLFGLILGYGAGVLYGFGTKRKRTLAIEVGMQNAGLGVLLALKHFSPQAALIPAVFAIWCIITASVLAEIWGKEGKCNQTKMEKNYEF